MYKLKPMLEGDDEMLAVELFKSGKYGVAVAAIVIGCSYSQIDRTWRKHGLKRTKDTSHTWTDMFKKRPALSPKPTRAECLAKLRRGESL